TLAPAYSRDSGSPPWIMNSGITRWNASPSKNGDVTHLPVLGSFQGCSPRASPTNDATVLDADSWDSSHVIFPSHVLMAAMSFPLAGNSSVASARESFLKATSSAWAVAARHAESMKMHTVCLLLMVGQYSPHAWGVTGSRVAVGACRRKKHPREFFNLSRARARS